MAKRLLQLADETIDILRQHPETGMGFYVVKGHFPRAYVDSVFVIAGDHYLLPMKHPDFFCVADLLSGVPLPEESEKMAGFTLSSSAPARNAASLPTGYKSATGCVPLVRTTTLAEPVVVCRYLASEADPRSSDSRLPDGTYLTTRLDLNDVHTGFAAVGRYALPVPVAASHVFEYELPAGTHVQVGAVLSCFGQVGGGVEVRLTAPTSVTPGNRVLLLDF
jgi:hypothetical protein